MRRSLTAAPRTLRHRLLALTGAAALGAGLLAAVGPADAAMFSPNNAQSLTVGPGATVSSSAHQTGAGALTEDVNVTLTGLSADNPSDLTVTLTAPNDAVVTLMSHNCGTAPLSNATLTFNQQAGTSVSVCAGSGAYVPVTSLGALNRINPWGDWTISIQNSGTGTATLAGGFSVDVSTSAFQNLLPASGNSGAAKLYPTNFTVKGRAGTLTGVNVALKGVSDTSVGDLDALLVSPSGTAIWLLSDACDGTSVTNVDWTFSSTASAPIPASGACGTGTYQPANYDGGDPDTMAAPAPAAANATGLAAFDGEAANGTWTLWVMDDNAAGGTGNGIGGGGFIQAQSLTVTTTGNPAPVIATPANLDTTAPQTKITHRPKRQVHLRHTHFTFTSSEAGSTFQCKLDRRAWKSCATVFRAKNLQVHRHRFKVRAIDSAGNVDPTPAVARWRVLSRHLPQHHRPDTHQ